MARWFPFAEHYDDSISVGSAQSEFTLLIYLTGEEDGVKGGGTAFYSNGQTLSVSLARGRACLHRHGRECMLHEGLPVEAGSTSPKWVLRSDLLYA